MDINLRESYERMLDEVDMLEFDIEGCEGFQQQISLAAQIIKKLYLIEILKIMQPVEAQLNKTDLIEFRSSFKEWSLKVDIVAKALQNGDRIDCDETVMDILDRMLPYLKGRIKNLTYYKKSRQIQIAA
ncbi:MAG: hypothetical protein FIA99_11200 [Ruminiclostridium sp.]|nr:hypothetical protein [Ruminiclostridium sp.]